ncbi:Flagellin N-methylase [Symmachiella dynata]|uniref:Flagellin N-methylase n=1 Tax=Symmachiella dynata TaxID=2527995 RepID=A0A517ZMY7_9PLAN|nr:Flagellin N-methylase [Symmachiella dynata]
MVWVTDEELHQIAEFIDEPVGAVKIEHTKLFAGRRTLKDFANGDCTFFDPEKRGCTIYPVRPIQCRTWPFWESNLESEAEWEDVKRECPGAGQGNFFSLEQIEAEAAKIQI